MKLRTILLILICAALSFGGSFTCRSDNNSDDFTENPQTGVP